MKILKNGTYNNMIAFQRKLGNRNFDLETENKSLLLQVKTVTKQNDDYVDIAEQLEKAVAQQTGIIDMLEKQIKEQYRIENELHDEIDSLKKERANLKRKLTIAQKNDMPKDAKTGRFVSKNTLVKQHKGGIKIKVVAPDGGKNKAKKK